MTILENLKNKNIDELVEWIDEYCSFDEAVHWKWWDENYCKKCESVEAFVPAFNRKCECAWCEINKKCRFFQDMDDIPNEKQIIKMWLESEYKDI